MDEGCVLAVHQVDCYELERVVLLSIAELYLRDNQPARFKQVVGSFKPVTFAGFPLKNKRLVNPLTTNSDSNARQLMEVVPIGRFGLLFVVLPLFLLFVA